MTRIHSYTTRQIETDNGDMLDLPYSDPFDNSIIEDTLIIKNAGAERPTFGGYLLHDSDAFSHWEWPEGVEVHEIPTRDRYMYDPDPDLCYVREIDMRHTVDYVSTDDWEDAAFALTVPEDVPAEHRADYMAAVLQEYSQVCSGDSYLIVIASWDHDGKEIDSSVVGGYHGCDYALSELAAELKTENEDTYR